MARVWALGVGIIVATAACSSSSATPGTVGGKDGGTPDGSTPPPGTDAASPVSDDAGGTVVAEDGDIRATACTASPFVTFTATVSKLDVSGAKGPLAGAQIGFSTCAGYEITTDSTGIASTQITQGIPLTPLYNAGPTVLSAIGGEIPATGDVSPVVTVFAFDVTPSIPGFSDGGTSAPTIAMFLQVDPSATAPCTDVTGVTLAVTGHPEAVVSYAGTDWPANTSVTTTSSVGPYVFLNGIAGATKVAVTGAKSGCSVKLVTASQTGNFQLVAGAVTIGLATITN